MSTQDNKLKVRPEQLPEAIRDLAQSISKNFEVPLEDVLSQYLISLNDEWLKTDPQFKTDAENVRNTLSN